MGTARRSMRLKDKAPVPAAPSGVKKTTRKSKSSTAAAAAAASSATPKGRKSNRTAKAVETKKDDDASDDKFPAREVVDEQGNQVDTGTLEYCLVFLYPRANTPGCTTQACGFRDGIDKLKEAGYEVFGLSYDTPAAQKKWKDKHNLPYRFLCDKPAKDNLIKALGCHKAPKSTRRSHFVIGAQGTILHKIIDVKPKDSIAKAIAFCEENPKPEAKAKEDDADAEMADVDAKDDDAEMKDEKADEATEDATEAKEEDGKEESKEDATADDAKDAEAKDEAKDEANAEEAEPMTDDVEKPKPVAEPATEKPSEAEPATAEPTEEKSMDIEPVADKKPEETDAAKESEAAAKEPEGSKPADAEEEKDAAVDGGKGDEKEKASEPEKTVESEKDGGDTAASIVANDDGKATEVEEALINAEKPIRNGEVGDTKISEDAKADEGQVDVKTDEAAKDGKMGEEKEKESADIAPAATTS